MSVTPEGHVITCVATALWDGITKPDKNEKDGTPIYSLKVALPPGR